MLPTITTAIDRIKPDADILVKDFIDSYLGNAYHEHFREYHNIEHITPMLDILDNVKRFCKNRDLIEFAWWYHDVIYIPGVSNCEELSAKKAEYDCRRLGFDEDIIKKISILIMATEHSERTDHPIPNDEKIIHDIDLVILGQPPESYKRYAQQIREEYFFVSDEEYKNGRAMIMSTFLARAKIYYHDAFQEYEEAARKNIQEEIEELNK